MRVRSRFAYSDKAIQKKDEAPNSSEKEEEWSRKGNLPHHLAGALQSPSGRYTPVTSLANLETLEDLLEAANNEHFSKRRVPKIPVGETGLC
jgi:hypothetical protein